MPGLSQLKKFNSDILSLGNEPALRASRGEKPVTVPIPKGIKDVSDADDFIMGMPEPVENPDANKPVDNGPEDFSDIMGLGSSSPKTAAASTPAEETGPAINFAMPDLTSLGAFEDSGDGMGGAPDLSMFDEPIEETEPEPEPEPEEPDIADMGLEALLGGAGFDGSEGEGEYNPDEEAEEAEEPVEEILEAEPVEEVPSIPEPVADFGAEELSPDEIPVLEQPAGDFDLDNLGLDTAADTDFGAETNLESNLEGDEFTQSPLSFDASDFDLGNLPESNDEPLNLDSGDSDFGADSFNFDDLPSSNGEESLSLDSAEGGDDFGISGMDFPESSDEPLSFDESAGDSLEEIASEPEAIEPEASEPEAAESFDLPENPDEPEAFKDSSFGDIDGLSLDAVNFDSEPTAESFDAPAADETLEEPAAEEVLEEPDVAEDALEEPVAEDNLDAPAASDFDDIKSPEAAGTDEEFAYDGAAIDMGEGLPESMLETDAGADVNLGQEEPAPAEDISFETAEPESASEDDFGADTEALLSGIGDMTDDIPGTENEDFSAGTDTSSEAADFASEGEDFGAAETDFSAGSDDFDVGSIDIDAPADFGESASDDFGDSSDLGDSADSTQGADNNDFPSDFNFDLSDSGDEGGDTFQESAPSETFDTSEMEGLDFGIPDTDDALEQGNFELGNSDDFAADNGEFEIPGFSDVQTVEVTKNGKIKVPTKEEEKEPESESDLPPNTLSDEQYEKFLKNLATYPLNVRMAVEELIVKNEFTDEAEFTIIQKVLKKVSARSLASELEKMLDIAISVPRDFERRTAEEYEAYKQSFQYQLANKIIPGAIVSIAAVIVCFFLFEFAKYFIYKPARANSLYRQGYTLLEQEDFPQSETKFMAATQYQLQKKWFFKYAHGYKDHKQYIRAEQMYKNILYNFKFDKTAGLEYAEMETYELANYEAAEKILLRDVLDHHINDADGILALGDNYLEWATEKDPEKYDEAVRRYADLIQLYGATDKYLSRMLRYYIRTDNLREVLQLKEGFFPRPKSLEGRDWTDLSGYCLEKLYGPLAPSDEYLRTKIEDVKEMLVRAIKTDKENPVAQYNISKYYLNTNNAVYAEKSLKNAITSFEQVNSIKKRDLYKYIDSHRLLGELYVDAKDYLKALESFTAGIDLYSDAHVGKGFEGTSDIGKLYANVGDIEYFIAGDYDAALQDFQDAVDTEYDNGQIRYKIGYIQYAKKNYTEAIGSFMKASEDFSNDSSLLLAMGNTLSLRNDNYAAEGYYERLIEQIDSVREQKGILFPQAKKQEAEIVDTYLKATNNLGVTLFRLAKRTGSSAMNAKAMVQFQESLRAWDTMTRNQQTMVRLGGSNLAEQNLKYVTHPMPEYEPAIYTDLSKTLSVEKGLAQ